MKKTPQVRVHNKPRRNGPPGVRLYGAAGDIKGRHTDSWLREYLCVTDYGELYRTNLDLLTILLHDPAVQTSSELWRTLLHFA